MGISGKVRVRGGGERGGGGGVNFKGPAFPQGK